MIEIDTTTKSRSRNNTTTAGYLVYEHIKNNLLEDAYDKLDRIPIETIAKDLNVSRQPVMDAMKRLSAEGFIEIIPQVGSRLRQYNSRDVLDFFQFFALTEAQITRLAAERANEEDIIRLRLISAQIGVLSRLKKPPKDVGRLYRTLNRKLHLEIANTARSEVIGDFVEVLRDKSDYFITWEQRFILAERIEASFNEHEKIIDAIEDGNGNLAALETKEHILAVDKNWIMYN